MALISPQLPSSAATRSCGGCGPARLERELTSFRLKLSASGRDSYEVQRREGEGHGDLTIAVALAAYRVNPSTPVEVVEAVEAV